MQKITFADNTEIEIKEGAALDEITVTVADFQALGMIADKLMTKGNLDTVKFIQDDIETGIYNDMALIRPVFREIDVTEDGVTASFGIREKTDIEKRLEVVETGQDIQDGAIAELASIIGGE